MGFYPQPNDYTCGPFALKHALVALGVMVDEDDVARLAQTHWWSGTDELRLSKAAHAYDCDLDYVHSLDSERARKALTSRLSAKQPLLLCVDDWGHWITVLRHFQGNFVIVNSLLDPVLNIASWAQLKRRWVYYDTDYDEEEPPSIYDFYAVKPRFRAPMRADFSLARVRHLRRPENHALAVHWDEYLADLLAICRPRSKRMVEPLSMGELLRRHQELIVSRTVYWHGDITAAAVTRLLRNFRFVAETYGLVVPSADKRRALADLCILTTLWVAAARGVGPMYGDGD